MRGKKSNVKIKVKRFSLSANGSWMFWPCPKSSDAAKNSDYFRA
jgi:hypothetical protein